MKLPFAILVFLKVFFFHRYQDRNEEVPFQVFLDTLFQDKNHEGKHLYFEGELATDYISSGQIRHRSCKKPLHPHSTDTPTDTNVLLTDGAGIAHGQKLFLSARRWDSYQGSSPVV